MVRQASRSNRDTPAEVAAPTVPSWQVSENRERPSSPPGRLAWWLLGMAIVLEAAWIAALAAMALLRR